MPCVQTFQSASSSNLNHDLFPALDESGLGWQTILSLASMVLSGMQAVLCLESAPSSRISFEKVWILFVLELCEIVVVIAAEFYSFFRLRSVLQFRLEWLYWAPYCLLIYGVLGLAYDVVFTVYQAYLSRVKWHTLSCEDEVGGHWYTAGIAFVFFAITTICSAVLIGWRQEWWFRAPFRVEEEQAIASTIFETSLSVGVISFCIGWAIVIMVFLTVQLLFFRPALERAIASAYGNEPLGRRFQRWGHLSTGSDINRRNWLIIPLFKQILWPHHNEHFLPNMFCRFEPERENIEKQRILLFLLREPEKITIERIKDSEDLSKMYTICTRTPQSSTAGLGNFTAATISGVDMCRDVSNEIRRCDNRIPLHIGNVQVGVHAHHTHDREQYENLHLLHTICMILEQLSFVPLSICLVVAVSRLRASLDSPTFETLKELADAVITFALLDAGMSFKRLVWGTARTNFNADNPLGNERSNSEPALPEATNA
ncbi:hypothetical protein FGB62_29g116 [Gracilaria domingensis]|nr:hypothetical protein FGB62_29g116 [Gracilaria domingensis]